MIKNKRLFLSNILSSTGLLWALEKVPTKPFLLVLNYHRIGDVNSTQYDKEVFSASEQDFDRQVSFFSKNYQVLSIDEIKNLRDTVTHLKKPAVIFTFDDGYRDNYELGFPILKKHNVPAVFFVPTENLENPKISWWDAVSYIVRKSQREIITIQHEGEKVVSLKVSKDEAIKDILNIIKQSSAVDYDHFVAMLSKACDVFFDNDEVLARELFMSKEQVLEMSQNNMLIGSHTHKHFILSKLSKAEQLQELQISKDKLTALLDVDVRLIAYPVGDKTAFNEVTKEVALAVGYDYGFSYYGGRVEQNHQDWFNVLREAVDHFDNMALLRTRVQALRLFKKSF